VDNFTLFFIGLAITIPTSIVVVALIVATGSDQREHDRLARQRQVEAASGV
jgi:hypothetical protein